MNKRFQAFAILAASIATFAAYGPLVGIIATMAMAQAFAISARGHVLGNTFDSALVTDVVRDVMQMVLQAKLAALNLFSRDFSTDVLAPKKAIQVPIATAGATGQTNATNFESGDSTLDNIAVTPNQLSVSFHITNAQYQQGFRLRQLLDINLHVLANMIMDAALAPATTTNFGAAVLTVAAADFGEDDMKVLYGAAKNYNQKNLVLDGSYLANLIPTDKLQFILGEAGAYGFDRIAQNNRWTGAGANVIGLLCDPQAIAVASGLSAVDPAVEKQMLLREIVTVPGLGISVQFCVWGSLGSRTVWGSFDVMFGSALGDATAGEVIKSS